MPFYESISGIGLKNEKNITIVLDFGAAYTKAGFAGEYGPRVITKSEVKCRETGKMVPVFNYKGEDELRHHLVDFIHKLYFRSLLVNPKDRRVVVVEDLLGSSLVRDTIASVLFRHYEVLSVSFVPSYLVAVMTLGCSTALVLDLGHNEARIVPVYEEVPILNAWQALPLGAHSVHSSLSELLLDRAMTICEGGEEQRLSAVMDELPDKILEDITVRTCFASTVERSNRLQNNKYDRSIEPPPPPPSIQYPLSGSHIMTIPGTVREMAAEVLFEQDRDNLCIPTMILNAIISCPVDTRKALAENLLFIGGLAELKGLKHRILAEVRALVTTPAYSTLLPSISFKLHTPPAKDNYVSWLGGAILGATEAVVIRSVSREQYLSRGCVPDWCNLFYNTRDERDQKTL
ncbi:hypothetical protein Pmani_000928 [Petrolisthes manimaculis]|uniref:Actin-related protein 10 n=1 Tax=Petrolisthes manimaculis TaxID=1843537 RepID=A0AAE1QL03_9EUCA|nr:hypothetical protein Pmani_000928 [Petrolisthes manimaculis]